MNNCVWYFEWDSNGILHALLQVKYYYMLFFLLKDTPKKIPVKREQYRFVLFYRRYQLLLALMPWIACFYGLSSYLVIQNKVKLIWKIVLHRSNWIWMNKYLITFIMLSCIVIHVQYHFFAVILLWYYSWFWYQSQSSATLLIPALTYLQMNPL